MSPSCRDDRFHLNDRPPDQRTDGQRDRDRILYASAFRRLGGVTQVAAAGEYHVFRNRLTHTLEVAQVARRLAEYTTRDQPNEAEALGGIDPDVVEAAALAHDLGHPPFGHVAEEILDELVRDSGNSDGFEGNPQSFRIVTKLALRHRDFQGLNLTRATLNAILKYPWTRGTDGGPRERKWGAYSSEEAEFNWAREFSDREIRSPEAELMDWADDITYSVHDLDDFYRAGLIPLDRLLIDSDERNCFLDSVQSRWERDDRRNDLNVWERITESFDALADRIWAAHRHLHRPYSGVREQRADLRSLTASLISRYVTNAITLRKSSSISDGTVVIDPEYEMEVKILKELTWEYVINSPALATQQYGQRRLIEDLFEILTDAASDSDFSVFPPRFSERLEETEASDRQVIRTVADYISSMTERQAIELHQRLTGASIGSVLDPFSP